MRFPPPSSCWGPTGVLALLERRGAAGFVLWRRRGRAVVETTAGLRSRYGLEPAAGVVVRERSRP
jgi:hypothetical protein